MKVVDHIKNAKGKTLFSFEILPILKGQSVKSIYDGIDPLMEFKPPFIDVTYSREEFVFTAKEKGMLERRIVRKRPGTVGICAALMNHYQVDAVPHIICGGFNQEETENALIDLDFLGIDNVLALRGDHIKSEGQFKPQHHGHSYATELVDQISNLNKGRYVDEEITNSHPTNFCIGVAGYPEKHFEAPNLKTDLKYLKMKQDLGAEYVVTQMFFDNQKYFDFVNKCREEGITIPIIPGLKPLTTLKQITVLPSIFHIDLPDALSDALYKCKNNEEVRHVGIEWGIQQSKELMKFGVPVLHYYSMGKSQSVKEIASELF